MSENRGFTLKTDQKHIQEDGSQVVGGYLIQVGSSTRGVSKTIIPRFQIWKDKATFIAVKSGTDNTPPIAEFDMLIPVADFEYFRDAITLFLDTLGTYLETNSPPNPAQIDWAQWEREPEGSGIPFTAPGGKR